MKKALLILLALTSITSYAKDLRGNPTHEFTCTLIEKKTNTDWGEVAIYLKNDKNIHGHDVSIATDYAFTKLNPGPLEAVEMESKVFLYSRTTINSDFFNKKEEERRFVFNGITNEAQFTITHKQIKFVGAGDSVVIKKMNFTLENCLLQKL
jgi:hypothetical protein